MDKTEFVPAKQDGAAARKDEVVCESETASASQTSGTVTRSGRISKRPDYYGQPELY